MNGDKVYYLITNIGTYDCSVEEFTDLSEAIELYRDYITAGIGAVLAQKLNNEDLEEEID